MISVLNSSFRSLILSLPPGPGHAPCFVPVRHSKASKRRKETQRLRAPHLVFKKKPPATPKSTALRHSDEHYAKVFQEEWASVRLGLMTRPKFAALDGNAGNQWAAF